MTYEGVLSHGGIPKIIPFFRGIFGLSHRNQASIKGYPHGLSFHSSFQLRHATVATDQALTFWMAKPRISWWFWMGISWKNYHGNFSWEYDGLLQWWFSSDVLRQHHGNYSWFMVNYLFVKSILRVISWDLHLKNCRLIVIQWDDEILMGYWWDNQWW